MMFAQYFEYYAIIFRGGGVFRFVVDTLYIYIYIHCVSKKRPTFGLL